ncbi:hypothetical protein Hanom_Chr09g00808541 [Helianthus anomalus]
MDANRACNGYRWTNERHLNFLKSVEASFVRTMLGNRDGGLLSMDRRVPDSCDSTLDSEMVIGRKKRKRRFLGGKTNYISFLDKLNRYYCYFY